MWENIIAIHSILKEKNYKTKFLTSLILKNKIDKDNFGKKKCCREKKESNTLWVKKKVKKRGKSAKIKYKRK
jgi:hypothetical protein